jgi:hypothetical protein
VQHFGGVSGIMSEQTREREEKIILNLHVLNAIMELFLLLFYFIFVLHRNDKREKSDTDNSPDSTQSSTQQTAEHAKFMANTTNERRKEESEMS